ncbi:MAG: bifunctional folylpolyglutamate synthase/dihydrofolate synthase [Candidatus Izemoplasmataceae bacterium]|jgi:dihydrofolate synthase / folylpolyglutamate synthase|uniref:bifunctional folylpolyglutamate synthase/dihydrofolate synthase n=1 Tax=Liberiplasma polymorphum TaxID=3374570 RepID=UPI003770B2BD
MFKHLEEAQKWIESVHRFGDKYDLVRMEKACEMLDYPQHTFKSIHVGGTNGKGSTVTYLKQIYLESGYSVGTYTSPYIVRFNERITLNNEEISDDELLYYINFIYDFDQQYLAKENDQISFFELVTLMSFLYFKDKQPDIVIVEVGLGGTLDATNVILPVASVITNIGYDHMNILGKTLDSIAKNKLGIVKENIPLITSVDQEELFPLFEATTQAKNSKYIHLKDYPIENLHLGLPTTFTFLGMDFTLNMAGIHQVYNATLAVLTAYTLHHDNLFAVTKAGMIRAIKQAFWPGRFEVFGNIIIDGAHNEQGLRACLNTVKAYYPERHVKSLFTVMADKDYSPMLSMLEKEVDEIIFTEINYPRCEKAKTLYDLSNHKNKRSIKDFKEAFKEAKPDSDLELLIITGSLYFISEVRKLLKG